MKDSPGAAGRARRREWLILAVTIVAVLGVLAVASAQDGVLQWNYLAGLGIVIVIYAVFALGLSLEFGFTGLVNFGHVGFMAMGAYAYGILMMADVGRPEHAAPVVGAFYDMAPALEGSSGGGALALAIVALGAATLAAVPLALLAGRLPWGAPRMRLAGALALASLFGFTLFLALFPLSADHAMGVATALSMLVGIALAALGGVLLGLPTVRLREDYLAIVTIGAAEILRLVLLNEEGWTRGSRNIVTFPRPLVDWALDTPWWNGLAQRLAIKPATLAILVVALLTLIFAALLLEALAKSPWGRVVRAIREDEEAAAALGKNVFAAKLQALALGSALAAAAGILLVTYLSNISPTHFLPLVTFYAFMILILGGIASHKGAIAGAFLLWGLLSLPQSLPVLTRIGLEPGPKQTLIVGLLLVATMMFRPQGLLGNKEELVHAK